MVSVKWLAAAAAAFAVAGVLMIAYARAETEVLYLNLDGRSWTLQNQIFTSHEDCDKAARRAMRNREALGAGCSVFVPERQGQAWQGQADDGKLTDNERLQKERQDVYDARRQLYERRFYAPK